MFKKLCCCIKREKKTVISYTESKKYLKNVEYRDTEAFVPPIVYGKVIKVYDGDTITVAAKLPFKGSPLYRFSVRLHSIDSPEIKGDTPNEKALAIISRDSLHKLIYGRVIELRNTGKEKYGRLLADVYLQDLHVNKWMLDEKLAIPYDGGKKIRPETWD
jgi:micrococcal nuclease